MNQRLQRTSQCWLWLMVLLLAPGAALAQLITDDFDAATLPYSLTAQGGWAAHSGAGTNIVQATTPTLTYAGLPTTGGSVALTTSGEDVNRQFTPQTSGSVYAAFLVNVATAQSAGDYFLHVGPTALGTTFIGRVFAKSAPGGFQLGASKGSDAAGPVYSSTVYAYNTTYFVVLKYTFVAGSTTNDPVDLFIQPAPGQPEPTASVSTTSAVADLANAGSVALRQGTASSAPGVRVDYIRIGTSWASVTSGSTVASLSANPITLTGFAATQGTVSNVQTYTLSGSNLDANPVSVSATANTELSTDNSSFTPTLSLPTTASAISQVVYTRLTNAAPAGAFSGTITNVSGSLTATVAVSGTVSSTAPVGSYTPIATARAGIGQPFTVQGRVTASNQLGARQIYIQDETGGIAVYSGPSGPDFSSLVNIGDLVQTRGPVTVFNGYLELTGTDNFTVVAGGGTSVPTPVAITPDQLANYQGQLVSIANASLTPVAATFTGGTNYTLTAAGQSATLRISANSPLAGAGQPANPVSVTGIADRFVSGATTTGTNGLQIQPRVLADIPGATPATDLTCTIGSASTLTRDQTLDIAAWNLEFFGADAGTISCPTGTTLVYNNFGPTDEARQQANATTVLTRLNADIISAEEVSDINRFDAAVKAMPGSYSYVCSNRFSYYFQDECDQQPSGNPPVVFGPTRLAQKVCVIYNTATVTPVLAETKPLLDGKYNYPNDNGWSSGRLPFLFVANVTINGQTQKIHVVALHAKSGSAPADYNRRKQDIIDLKAELDANYAGANIVMLGDYNDKLNGSINTGQPSSYEPFVTDATNYSAITLPLENGGCSTFNSSASFIDHIITSSELAPAYVSNSAYVLQPFSISNYGNTTSDHNPIVARFDLSQLVVTAPFAITGVTMVSCQTVTAGERRVSFTPQYTGLSGQPVSFSVVNELLPTISAGPHTLRLYTDNPVITLKATQSSTAGEARFTYNWLAACNGGETPPTSPFSITGVTMVNCETVTAGERRVSFTPQYAGLSGQPVSFSVVNELLPTTSTGPHTLRLYTDNPTITLKAVQQGTAGEASFPYNWLAVCAGGSGRVGAVPAAEAVLDIRVLGNPAEHGRVSVEVRGAAGQPLQLYLTDMRGQVVRSHRVESAGSVEQHTFEIGRQSAGQWLLRATTPSQSQTVKVLKAD